MLDLCYLWYSCDTAWDICVIMWWMCHIYVTLVWNVYMFFLWRWMWLIHKNRKHIKKQQQFAECFYPDTRQSNHFSISWKTYLPSVITLALGEVSNFAECQKTGTRQRPKLRRVPDAWHSAKTQTSPSAARLALGEVWIFAECRAYGTRQSFRPVPFGRPVRQFAVPFASSTVRPSVPFQLFLPSATWHTAKVCRVPEKRHSAKPASPVEERPCALRRVLHSAKKLPSVFRPLPSVCDTRQSTRVR